MRRLWISLLLVLAIARLLLGVGGVAWGQDMPNKVYLPMVARQLFIPAEGRCAMTKSQDTNGAQINWDVPTLAAGQRGILYIWRDGWLWQGKTLAKAIVGPSESPRQLKNAGGSLWVGACSPAQIEYEFSLNQEAAEINWQQLNEEGFIRGNETATPVPPTATAPTSTATASPTHQPVATATPSATSAPPGCSGMTKLDYPSQVIGPFPPGKGSIFTLYRGDIGEFKLWHPPTEGPWQLYEVTGGWWRDASGRCTTDQLYYEFINTQLPEKNWNELCALGITCPAAPTATPSPTATKTPVPTLTPQPTATATPTPDVCQDVQSETLERGDYLIPQRPGGTILFLWTDREVDPPWGTAEVKLWKAPEEPEWALWDAGGTALFSSTCSGEQLYQRFLQEKKQEVSWQELCDAHITCP